MNQVPASLLDAIQGLPADWHISGSVTREMLEALVRHAPSTMEHSVETGCGRTTLLLSHLSADHLVFARDDGAPRDGGSLKAVLASPLLNAASVRWSIGSTQETMRRHAFTTPLDLVLLDGPHAWPYPDLEYYATYPHIRAGGLLIVDDIHIPTIRNMWQFLREDAMWSELEVVGTSAFLRRTSAPVFNPLSDYWTEQAYNISRFPMPVLPLSKRVTLRRAVARRLPGPLRTFLRRVWHAIH